MSLKTVYDGPTDKGILDGAVEYKHNLPLPPTSRLIALAISVVAVHGLGANPNHAWTCERVAVPGNDDNMPDRFGPAEPLNTDAGAQPSVNWLRDFLPGEIPNARIMCYEYNSKWLGNDLPKQYLYGIAMGLLECLHQKDSGDRRPTIYIGHSYGGVVIEQALVQADAASSSYRHIGQRTAGIIFLGVPFRGSGAQRLGNMIASTAGIFGLAENNLMKDLGLDSEMLGNLLHQFSRIVWNRREQVICYYELRETSYAKKVPTILQSFSQTIAKQRVVDRSSGTIDGFPQFALDTDHPNMSRFKTKEDKVYVQLSCKISELVTACSLAHGKKSQEYVQDDSRINLLLKNLRNSLESQLNPGVGEAIDKERRGEVKLIEKCFRGLFLSNPLDDRQRIIDRKGEGVTGTCAWIVSNASYQAWSEGSDSKLLWLSGGPGKGKTVLSIFLTKELARLVEGDQNTTLVYFFCDNKNEKQKSALAILRSLILQLLRQRPDLFECILPEYRFARETLLSDRDALWRIFEKMISSLAQCKTYCVIDGLDECDPDSLSFLVMKLKATGLFKENPSGGSLKLIVVSRDKDELRRLSLYGFPNRPSCSHRVDLDSPSLREIVDTNLEKFIFQESEQLARENNYIPELREKVKRALREGGNGTFLWVAMVCRELREKSFAEVRETLARLPQGLDDVYKRMLDEVPQSRRDIVATIMRWVTLAARPLTLTELAIATNTPADDAPSLGEAMKTRVLYCRSFFEIDRDTRVNFIHQSAKDYLLDQAPSLFRVDKATASLESAQICHSYIRGDAFRDGPIITSRNNTQSEGGDEVWRRSEERLENFPFLAYATLHWPDHLRDSGSIVGIQFSEWKTNLREAWWETYCDMTHDNFYSKRTPTLLHVASYFGLTLLAKEILGDQRGRLTADEQTALPWAARVGHQAIVELLLGNGVDPNAKEEFGTALSWAAKNGHKPLVELLLKQEKVDVNSESHWGETPLSYAAGNGHEEVVRLLLDREDLDVSTKDKWGWMPLLIAAQNGHDTMVRLLLGREGVNGTPERTADRALLLAAEYGREAVVKLLLDREGVGINARDDENKTPLSFAAENGHEAVVRLLLGRRGIDLNARDRYGWTPLLMAARIANEAVTRLLLDQEGIHVDLMSNTGRSLLSLAAEHGLEAVVRLLLYREDVDPNSKDESNWTPLSYAAENGREAIVQLLLSWEGVDVNAPDGWGWTPLSMAARNGHEAVVMQLLDQGSVETDLSSSTGRTLLSFAAEKGLGLVVRRLLGAEEMELNSEDESDWTALLNAAQNGHEAVVWLLLGQKEVDVNLRDTLGRTVLSHAADNGHEAVVGLLLSRQGVDVNLGDNWVQTPLSYAAKRGHSGVVGLILGQQGVDANLGDSRSRTPLSYAAESGHERVVELILGWEGVDANLTDRQGRTPLSYAAENGHRVVVSLLLDRQGVDSNLGDSQGRTPLSYAAENGHGVVVEQILGRQGVDVNLGDIQGRTPLSYAAEIGHEVLVRQFLGRQGVDVNLVDSQGRTALSYTAGSGHEGVVGLILGRQDVDANLKDSQGRTPLSYAAENGHEGIVRLLLGQQDLDANLEDCRGRSPLSYAAENGQEVMVELLLGRHDGDFNPGDGWVWTALLSAVRNGHERLLKLLLSRSPLPSASESWLGAVVMSMDRQGMDFNLEDSQGRTLLSSAAVNGYEAVVRLLLRQQGVDVNLGNSQGRTPLSIAAGNRHKEVVELLLDQQGVDVNLGDSQGRTPLSYAAESGHEQVVELILGRKGVDVNLGDSQGRTPLSYAAENRHEGVVRLLLSRTPLSSVAEKLHEKVVRLLLVQQGRDVNLEDSQGRTLLSSAAENGYEAVVRLLLDRQDVDVNLTDSRGQTPLSYAAGNGHESVVRLILGRQDLDAYLEDKSGRTPLSHAAGNGHEAVARLLLDPLGVGVNLKDSQGRTPLSYAAENGHKAVVRLLKSSRTPRHKAVSYLVLQHFLSIGGIKFLQRYTA